MDTVLVHEADKIHNLLVKLCPDVSVGHFQKLFRALQYGISFSVYRTYGLSPGSL